MTREETINDCINRLRPLGMVAMAVSFVDPNGNADMEQLLAFGPLPRLASMSAGVLDRTQNNLFTRMQRSSDMYDRLMRDSFMTPHSAMSISICVDGEWRRIDSEAALRKVLTV